MPKNRTPKDKQEAIKHVEYEIWMLSRTALLLNRKLKRPRPLIVHNALINSFLLATRNLLEFFFPEGKKNSKLHVNAFVESWKCNEPSFKEKIHWHKVNPDKKSPRANTFRAILSQRLQHITWDRVDESQLDWHEPAITKEFLRPIEKFQAALPTEFQSKTFDVKVRKLQKICKRFEQQ